MLSRTCTPPPARPGRRHVRQATDHDAQRHLLAERHDTRGEPCDALTFVTSVLSGRSPQTQARRGTAWRDAWHGTPQPNTARPQLRVRRRNTSAALRLREHAARGGVEPLESTTRRG
jgi:hypothetical protein